MKFALLDGNPASLREIEALYKPMNLSPWFKPAEPPEHEGRYQIKDWIGHINYAEWWKGEWRDPKTYDRIPTHRIRAWRGVIKP